MEIDLIMKPKEWKNGCGMKLSFGSKGSQYYLALLADHPDSFCIRMILSKQAIITFMSSAIR